MISGSQQGRRVPGSCQGTLAGMLSHVRVSCTGFRELTGPDERRSGRLAQPGPDPVKIKQVRPLFVFDHQLDRFLSVSRQAPAILG